MNRFSRILPLVFLVVLQSQSHAQSPASSDPWQALSFLQGTWSAKTGDGSAAKVIGSYTFAKELKEHVMARHSTTAGCTGPSSYDCEHSDLLYIYEDQPGQTLKALYADNEGHVIHYVVMTPEAGSVVLLSEPGPGPRFRLVYRLEKGVMTGKFQIQVPGQEEWRSYLEWSGGRL